MTFPDVNTNLRADDSFRAKLNDDNTPFTGLPGCVVMVLP